jgi:hypothetical protein
VTEQKIFFTFKKQKENSSIKETIVSNEKEVEVESENNEIKEKNQ